MTHEENNRIELLTVAVNALAGEVHTLNETTNLRFGFFRERCDERHGVSDRREDAVEIRMGKLEDSGKIHGGFMERIKGMAIPAIFFLSLLSLILSLVLR